jgi:hypothetical protein
MASIEKGAVTNTEDMFAHAASIVQQNIYALDSDHYSGYMWVAALDWKTCLVCGSLDGHIFDALPGQEGEDVAPEQPIHHACRCVMVPVLKGMEDDYTKGAPTYKDWLARQPENRIIDILGPSKYAAYKNGMPIERFVKDGRVLTLKELGIKLANKSIMRAEYLESELGFPKDVATNVKARLGGIRILGKKDRKEHAALMDVKGNLLFRNVAEK